MEKNKWGRNRLNAYGISDEKRIQELESGKIWCCGHKQFLPHELFARQDRPSCRCKECAAIYERDWHSKNKPKRNQKSRDYYKENSRVLRDYQKNRRANMSADERQADAFKRRLKSRFGLTPKQYEEKLAQQGGGCAVCGSKQNGLRLPVDHKHSCCPGRKSCGKCIRGILCVKCNTIIGFLEMNRELVPLCEAYLISHQ